MPKALSVRVCKTRILIDQKKKKKPRSAGVGTGIGVGGGAGSGGVVEEEGGRRKLGRKYREYAGAKATRKATRKKNACSQSRSIKKGFLPVLLKWLDDRETRLFRACSSFVGSTSLMSMSHISRPKVPSETQLICYHTGTCTSPTR